MSGFKKYYEGKYKEYFEKLEGENCAAIARKYVEDVEKLFSDFSNVKEILVEWEGESADLFGESAVTSIIDTFDSVKKCIDASVAPCCQLLDVLVVELENMKTKEEEYSSACDKYTAENNKNVPERITDGKDLLGRDTYTNNPEYSSWKARVNDLRNKYESLEKELDSIKENCNGYIEAIEKFNEEVTELTDYITLTNTIFGVDGNSSFENMTLDEKLAYIQSVIDNYGKVKAQLDSFFNEKYGKGFSFSSEDFKQLDFLFDAFDLYWMSEVDRDKLIISSGDKMLLDIDNLTKIIGYCCENDVFTKIKAYADGSSWEDSGLAKLYNGFLDTSNRNFFNFDPYNERRFKERLKEKYGIDDARGYIKENFDNILCSYSNLMYEYNEYTAYSGLKAVVSTKIKNCKTAMKLLPYEDKMKDPAFQKYLSKDYSGYAYLSRDNLSVMSDEEKALYAYLRDTQGDSAARGYLDALQTSINERIGFKRAQEYVDWIAANGWGVDDLINSGFEGVKDGFRNFWDGIGDIFRVASTEEGELSELDYEMMYKQTMMQKLMRDEGYIGQSLRENSLGFLDITNWYSCGSSIGNMIVPSIVGFIPGAGPALSSALMTASIGGNSAVEARQNGATIAQAYIYGGITGASEALTEKVLGGIPGVSKMSGGSFVKDMIGEGMEEFVQEYLDAGVRNLVLGENNDLFSNAQLRQSVTAFGMGSITSGIMQCGNKAMAIPSVVTTKVTGGKYSNFTQIVTRGKVYSTTDAVVTTTNKLFHTNIGGDTRFQSFAEFKNSIEAPKAISEATKVINNVVNKVENGGKLSLFDETKLDRAVNNVSAAELADITSKLTPEQSKIVSDSVRKSSLILGSDRKDAIEIVENSENVTKVLNSESLSNSDILNYKILDETVTRDGRTLGDLIADSNPNAFDATSHEKLSAQTNILGINKGKKAVQNIDSRIAKNEAETVKIREKIVANIRDRAVESHTSTQTSTGADIVTETQAAGNRGVDVESRFAESHTGTQTVIGTDIVTETQTVTNARVVDIESRVTENSASTNTQVSNDSTGKIINLSDYRDTSVTPDNVTDINEYRNAHNVENVQDSQVHEGKVIDFVRNNDTEVQPEVMQATGTDGIGITDVVSHDNIIAFPGVDQKTNVDATNAAVMGVSALSTMRPYSSVETENVANTLQTQAAVNNGDVVAHDATSGINVEPIYAAQVTDFGSDATTVTQPTTNTRTVQATFENSSTTTGVNTGSVRGDTSVEPTSNIKTETRQDNVIGTNSSTAQTTATLLEYMEKVSQGIEVDEAATKSFIETLNNMSESEVASFIESMSVETFLDNFFEGSAFVNVLELNIESKYNEGIFEKAMENFEVSLKEYANSHKNDASFISKYITNEMVKSVLNYDFSDEILNTDIVVDGRKMTIYDYILSDETSLKYAAIKNPIFTQEYYNKTGNTFYFKSEYITNPDVLFIETKGGNYLIDELLSDTIFTYERWCKGFTENPAFVKKIIDMGYFDKLCFSDLDYMEINDFSDSVLSMKLDDGRYFYEVYLNRFFNYRSYLMVPSDVLSKVIDGKKVIDVLTKNDSEIIKKINFSDVEDPYVAHELARIGNDKWIDDDYRSGPKTTHNRPDNVSKYSYEFLTTEINGTSIIYELSKCGNFVIFDSKHGFDIYTPINGKSMLENFIETPNARTLKFSETEIDSNKLDVRLAKKIAKYNTTWLKNASLEFLTTEVDGTSVAYELSKLGNPIIFDSKYDFDIYTPVNGKSMLENFIETSGVYEQKFRSFEIDLEKIDAKLASKLLDAGNGTWIFNSSIEFLNTEVDGVKLIDLILSSDSKYCRIKAASDNVELLVKMYDAGNCASFGYISNCDILFEEVNGTTLIDYVLSHDNDGNGVIIALSDLAPNDIRIATKLTAQYQNWAPKCDNEFLARKVDGVRLSDMIAQSIRKDFFARSKFDFEEFYSSMNINEQIDFIKFFSSNCHKIIDGKFLYDMNADELNFCARYHGKYFANSNSMEMKKFELEILASACKTADPDAVLERISEIFTQKGVPEFVKRFEVFDTIHPNIKYDPILNGGKGIKSPVLLNMMKRSIDGNMSRERIVIFGDLVKSAFTSNNTSVRNLLNTIEVGNQLFENVSNNTATIGDLTVDERIKLSDYRDSLVFMYNNTERGKATPYISTGDLQTDISNLSSLFSVNEIQSLPDRIIRTFCYAGGEQFSSFESAKTFFEESTKNAHERGITFAESHPTIELVDGDIVKGVKPKFLFDILQNGSLCQEFLGVNQETDCTPLDTDAYIVKNGSVQDSSSFGRLMFVMKNDERFITTSTADTKAFSTGNLDLNKLELFYNGFLGDSHYCIRTGFGSTNIDYMMISDIYYDLRLGFDIARSGFYIPIYSKDTGKLLFSPSDYEMLRSKMAGLSYYGTEAYQFSDYLVTKDIVEFGKQLGKEIDASNKVNNIITENIEQAIVDGLPGITVERGIDGDIRPGTFEVLGTGSTSRGNNVPGDADYDFVIRVDNEYTSNEGRERLYEVIKAQFPNRDVSQDAALYDKLRLYGVKIDGLSEPVDIDISPVQKTNLVQYSTEMSLTDRMSNIRNQSVGEDADYVTLNVLYAKQFMKDLGVYHKGAEGGLGGVGIETLVLQNGGSFVQAAADFVSHCNGLNFETAKRKWGIYDFGQDHYAGRDKFTAETDGYEDIRNRNDNFLNDNFLNNMTKDGYDKVLNALKQYLKDNKIKIDPVTGKIIVESVIESTDILLARNARIAQLSNLPTLSVDEAKELYGLKVWKRNSERSLTSLKEELSRVHSTDISYQISNDLLNELNELEETVSTHKFNSIKDYGAVDFKKAQELGFIVDTNSPIVSVSNELYDVIDSNASMIRERAERYEKDVTPLIKSFESDTVCLMGEDHKLKGVDSIKRKIELDASNLAKKDGLLEVNEEYVARATDRISDSLRYTVITSDDSYVDTIESMLSSFEEQGYTIRCRNSWGPDSVYQGVNTNLTKTIDGETMTIEIQFHTEDSYVTKENYNHEIYEVRRNKFIPSNDKELAKQISINLQKLVPVPKNIIGYNYVSKSGGE